MKKKRAAKRPLISWLWQSYNWSAAVPSIFHSSVPPFPTLIDKPLTCNAEQNQEFLLFFYWAPHHHFKWPFFFLPLHKRIICCLEFRFFATTKLSDPSHLKILNLNFQKLKPGIQLILPYFPVYLHGQIPNFPCLKPYQIPSSSDHKKGECKAGSITV